MAYVHHLMLARASTGLPRALVPLLDHLQAHLPGGASPGPGQQAPEASWDAPGPLQDAAALVTACAQYAEVAKDQV
jgi:hypothetical protein